ncbi:hypothetical protein ROZALSC1DRAFT_26716 [Rozella allomycis CSF55]|uniref:Mitochondrial import inner membrane translocase subunit n=1 Tax=Rozella allomycis (strain CSF55) TaxID=988480 RepID=A0A075AMK0_ROZAC|nr:hypothetical protein O9G_003073 [Rozella allomycis CSF55]RKP21885.1 hypothetical protein ROZALSC1DRAFT_26716 [Rozella allomycis CSF55]|eukprot:EPZ30838.1 hypothetical protein O9G_003073 [Rozella allomycis CSF55]
MDFSHLSESERQHLLSVVEEQQRVQLENFMFNTVSACFKDCVNDFTSHALSGKEGKCLNSCAKRMLNFSNRLSLIIAEKFQDQALYCIFEDIVNY